MKKRLLSTLLALCMVLTLLPGTAWAATAKKETVRDDFQLSDSVTSAVDYTISDYRSLTLATDYASIQVGDYIELGKYYGEPILWRCVSIDENGPLMLSDKILCLKAYDASYSGYSNSYRKTYGSNFWNTSCLRQWLNSNDILVNWLNGVPNRNNVWGGYNAYADEAGFMSNFTADELKLVKPVTQKTYINSLDSTLKDGGSKKFDIGQGNFSSIFTNIGAKTADAWYVNSTDSFFLLGPEQAAAVYETFGADYLMAFPTVQAVEQSGMKDRNFSSNNYWIYWLRLPMNTGMSYENVSAVDANGKMSNSRANGARYAGVRPAFYLNCDAANVCGFNDVKSDDWFADSVKWAVENNVTSGTSDTTFSPNDVCTTAQILTFLWRANGSLEPRISNPFPDVKSNDYYYKAALWAYENSLVSGNILSGNTRCTRADVVTYLWKLAGHPSYSGGSFSDVSPNAAYADAVAWAVDNGITSGTSATTFSPNQTCTRAQIVTFLYRFSKLGISTDQISLYAGPGKNYQYLGTIEVNRINKYICEESNWIEIEYNNRWAYVQKNTLTSLDVSSLPLVTKEDISGPTLRPYWIFFSGLEIELTCETLVRGGPGSSYAAIETLPVGTVVTILTEDNDTGININPYLLVEYKTYDGLKRGYAQRNTVLDVNNPLKGFDAVKKNNARFEYQGRSYYSTAAYHNALDGWMTKHSASYTDKHFDWLAAVVGVISSNSGEEQASKKTLEKETWLYNSKANTNIAVNTQNNGAFFTVGGAVIDLVGIANAALENGNDDLTVHVDLETYQNEGRIIIRGGTPFEAPYYGKTVSLSSLIAKNSAPALVESGKRADEMIRSICPELLGADRYSMEITFSGDFSDNPYGCYFIVGRDGTVYEQLIVHSGTHFNIYQSGKFVADIAPRISGMLMQLNEEDASRILNLLNEHGFSIK